jgi:hypothetical protein
MSTKTCSKCGVEKDVIEFGKDKSRKDGLECWCKLCKKEYREANREEIRTKKKEHYQANREEILAKNSERYKTNREERLAKGKEYYKANREEKLVKRKEYYNANRQEILTKNKSPEARARQRTLEYHEKVNARMRHRRKINSKFNIISRLRLRIYMALKTQGAKKFTSTMDLIGCSPEFLTKHLEKQIKPGTKREDYHVDHIIPCALFDLTKEEEQKMCFHWTNLQLLLGPANMSKGDDVFWSGQVYKPDEVPSEIREEIYAHCRSNMTLRSS